MDDKKAEELAEKLIRDMIEQAPGRRVVTSVGPTGVATPNQFFGFPPSSPPSPSPFSSYPPANQLPADLLEWSFENGRMKITLPADKVGEYWRKLKKIMDLCVKQ